MKISEASAGDIAAINRLVNSAYRGDSSRKGWTTEADLLDGLRTNEAILQGYIDDPHSAILKCLDADQKLVGCVYLKKEMDNLYLGMLTVAPQLQAKGIGKALLRAAEERAEQLSCEKIIMTVISVRQELIDWYKRHGYTETGEREPFPESEAFGKPRQSLEFIVLEKMITR